MVDLSGIDRKTIVDRAKAIILKPKEEWPKVALETTTQGDILRSYVLPLAAIGPLASLIGGQAFGYGAFGFSYRPPLIGSIISAVISYGLAIVAVFLLAFIADFLAPKFGGQSNRLNAFKLIAYGSTAAWLAGIFSLVPALAFFGLLGLYSVYLYYTGATPLMAVPQDKAVGYTAVTILCAVVLMIVIAPITAVIAGLFGGGAAMIASTNDTSGGTVTIPGVGSIDVGKAEQFSKQMEDAASGKSPPVEAAKMQQLLPAAIGSFQRTATQTLAMGAMGSTAEGTYTAADKSFTLRVADMSALGALAGLGAAMGVEQTREDADGYERTQTVDGQMQTEAWNRTNGSGKFGRVVGNRFMIEAEGSADSIDQLKAAVASVDQGSLVGLAR
jgi:hypothetical protein